MTKAMRVPISPINEALNAICQLEERVGWSRSRGRIGASLLAVARVPTR